MQNEGDVPWPHLASYVGIDDDVPSGMLGGESGIFNFGKWCLEVEELLIRLRNFKMGWPCWMVMAPWMGYPYHICVIILMLAIATLWHISLCEPSMWLLGREVVVPSFLRLLLPFSCWCYEYGLYLPFLGFYGRGWGWFLPSGWLFYLCFQLDIFEKWIVVASYHRVWV